MPLSVFSLRLFTPLQSATFILQKVDVIFSIRKCGSAEGVLKQLRHMIETIFYTVYVALLIFILFLTFPVYTLVLVPFLRPTDFKPFSFKVLKRQLRLAKRI